MATLKLCEASHDGGIVAEGAVAVQFGKIGEKQADEIERVRPLRMARQLRALPGAQMRIEFAAQFGDLLAKLFEVAVLGTVSRQMAQTLHFAFELLELAAPFLFFHQGFSISAPLPRGQRPASPANGSPSDRRCELFGWTPAWPACRPDR